MTTLILARGSHQPPSEDCDTPERCLFEWYNWLTRHRHTDARPPGVSPFLHRFGIALNDILPDDRRQELRRFLPNGTDRLAGTERDGKNETRGYIVLDWLIRTWTPAWLSLAGLNGEAAALRDLHRITGLITAQSAGPVVRHAHEKATAAWAAAWAASQAAAGAAAWATARAAARTAAGSAARSAAWDAAWDAVAPTVTELQVSAITLYDTLITGEWPKDTPHAH